MIKGLKPGTSYRVRVVARDPTDPTVHSTDEVLVAVPGEAACLRVDLLVLSFFSIIYLFFAFTNSSSFCYFTVHHIWSEQVFSACYAS